MNKHRSWTMVLLPASTPEGMKRIIKRVKNQATKLKQLDEHCPGCAQCRGEEKTPGQAAFERWAENNFSLSVKKPTWAALNVTTRTDWQAIALAGINASENALRTAETEAEEGKAAATDGEEHSGQPAPKEKKQPQRKTT